MRIMSAHPPRVGARKRPANLSLSAALLAEAKALGVNISQACEAGLEEKVREARAAAWLAQNMPALDSSNAFVERSGLPLARHRRF
ncbi:MAG: type II toxin-antitoxin system CcdA family antitoxin [Allosphingosinicella sp.]